MEYDYEGTVVMRRTHDPYGISSYYAPECRLTGGRRSFYWTAAIAALRANILHISAGIKHAGLLRRISAGSVMVLHYHGSDVRDVPYEARMDIESRADCILVSTPDLLEYRYGMEPTYLHNPVDTDLFSPRKIPENNRGLVLMKPGQKAEPTLQRLRDMGFGGVEWDLAERSYDAGTMYAVSQSASLRLGSLSRIRYADMPSLLSRYEYYGEAYYNASDGTWYGVDSTTGLQAMSLGLKVVRPDGTVATRLPDEHRPERVASKVRSMYEVLMQGAWGPGA